MGGKECLRDVLIGSQGLYKADNAVRFKTAFRLVDQERRFIGGAELLYREACKTTRAESVAMNGNVF